MGLGVQPEGLEEVEEDLVVSRVVTNYLTEVRKKDGFIALHNPRVLSSTKGSSLGQRVTMYPQS